MNRRFYVTTPIYYVNARPHLGHAYTTIVADVLNRFHAMCGQETFFLTGTDEHGDKVVRAAKKAQISPLAYADEISHQFRDLWPKLGVEPSRFIRTTESSHMTIVTDILQKIYDLGDIYFSEYEGAYCFGCERFYTDRELVNGKCPDHNSIPEIVRESNYFFRMGRYQEWLIEHIESNPDFITPERYRNEVLSFLKEPLDDLCISRPKSRLQWGITLPFDQNYVTYVWFDALINYISGLGYPANPLFEKFWPAAHHIVAKDILKPHGIFWPTMLKAAGLPVYRQLHVHGYWNIDSSKMSKTLGNIVDPAALAKEYGEDAFRYFVTRDMVFGLDADFSEKNLVQRINSDLANDLGNLFTRSLTMVHRYLNGIVPLCDAVLASELDEDLKAKAEKTVEDYSLALEKFELHKALIAVWELINRVNKYIDTTAPWELAKNKAQHDILKSVLYNVIESLRVISGLLYPFMPKTSRIMYEHLGLGSKDAPCQIPCQTSYQTIDDLRLWGGIKSGTQVHKAIALFPRVELAVEEHSKNASNATKKEKEKAVEETTQEISFDFFKKIDLRVATVVDAEPVLGSEKLLKLTVDLGELRTVVAGIAGSYAPNDIIGKQVVVVANLKPIKLMGVESHGMVLAAKDADGLRLISPNKSVKAGCKIS